MAGTRSPSIALACLLLILSTLESAAQDAVFTMNDDVFAAGADLRVTGTAGGDLFAAGGSLEIDAGGAQDVIAAGGQVFVSGPIAEDAILTGGIVTLTGPVAEDLLLSGGRIRVDRGARIGGDARIAGGRVTLDGTVAGDAALVGGRMVVGGEIGGDLEAAGGRLEILSGSRIGGSVIFRGDRPPTISPGATVAGAVDHVAGSGRPERWDRHRGIGWIGRIWVALSVIVTGIVVILLIPGLATRATERLREHPVACALLGIALLAGIPLLAILLMATVIAIPLGIIVMMLYPAALFLGFVVGAFALSEWAIRRRVATPTPVQRFAAFALAVAVLAIVYAIPWLGGWLVLITLLLGMGAFGQALFAARGTRLMAS